MARSATDSKALSSSLFEAETEAVVIEGTKNEDVHDLTSNTPPSSIPATLSRIPTDIQLISQSLRVPAEDSNKSREDEIQIVSDNNGRAQGEPHFIERTDNENGPPLPFGAIERISPWIPRIDPNIRGGLQHWWSDRKAALSLRTVVSFIVLGINIGLVTGAASNYSVREGVGTLYLGTCSKARNLNSWIHVGINVMSTILLGISNYCMQILIAPNREEIDAAHERETWLDIGAPSVRNFRRIKWDRQVAWLGLALSSGLLHMTWNSAVFASFPYVSYTVAFVRADFFTNSSPWPTPELNRLREAGLEYERMDRIACIERYMDQLSGAGDVIVVTNGTVANSNSPSTNTSSLILSHGLSGDDTWATQQEWMCGNLPPPCTLDHLLPTAQDWIVTVDLDDDGVSETKLAVDYCLAGGTQSLESQCGLHVNTIILYIVCGMNLVKCLAVLYTLALLWRKNQRHVPLVTLGDAIASFLHKSDPTTVSMCLRSQTDFRTGGWSEKKAPLEWKGVQELRRWSAASRGRWAITTSLCLFLLLFAGVGLTFTLISHKKAGPISGSAIWNYGLGEVHSRDLLFFGKQFWTSIAIANSWQLEVSCVYLLYNALVTTLCVAEEWNRFGRRRDFLRVSSPRGMQRSTLFLSLPYRYSIPLLICMGLLHFFISQSIFLVQAIAISPEGDRIYEQDSSRVGYSSLGIIWALVIGGLLLIGLLILGSLELKCLLPMASTNSAAISAAVHGSKEDTDAAFIPVQWGVILEAESAPQDSGRCGFTTSSIIPYPEEGKRYA